MATVSDYDSKEHDLHSDWGRDALKCGEKIT